MGSLPLDFEKLMFQYIMIYWKMCKESMWCFLSQRCLWKRSFQACCQMRRSDRTRGSLATSPSAWSSAGTCVCRTHPWNWLSPRRETTWTKTCFLSMGGREGWWAAVFGQLCFYTKMDHLYVKVMFCRKRERRSRATIHL